MLAGAPLFAEVLPAIQSRVHGAHLVCHNLAFDVRMIAQELARSEAHFAPGVGYCTYLATRCKLNLAAELHGIRLANHHRALCDARVTAELLLRLHVDPNELTPARLKIPSSSTLVRTLRREATGWTPHIPLVRRMTGFATYPTSDFHAAAYFDLLDWALSDGVLTSDEQVALSEAACRMRLGPSELHELHQAYVQSIRSAVLRDGRVTPEESQHLERTAASLGVTMPLLEPTTPSEPASFAAFPHGTCVCFTGSAMSEKGEPIARSALESMAASRGMQPVERVTKKHCQLVVAQDPSSLSGKARKAAEYQIPVISVKEFLERIGA